MTPTLIELLVSAWRIFAEHILQNLNRTNRPMWDTCDDIAQMTESLCDFLKGTKYYYTPIVLAELIHTGGLIYSVQVVPVHRKFYLCVIDYGVMPIAECSLDDSERLRIFLHIVGYETEDFWNAFEAVYNWNGLSLYHTPLDTCETCGMILHIESLPDDHLTGCSILYG